MARPTEEDLQCTQPSLAPTDLEALFEAAIANVVIMLLLYADDVVLLANTLGDALKLMKALEFCACILN